MEQETTQTPESHKDEGTKRRLKFLEKESKKLSTSDRLLIILLAYGALLLIDTLFLIFTNINVANLANKATPSLVQLSDGNAIRVAPLGNKERSPQVIDKFVSDTLTKMFKWAGTKPANTVEEITKPQPDYGVDVGLGNNKVSASAYEAAFALSEDFRKEFLKGLAAITPQGVFASTQAASKTQVFLVPLEVQPPKNISEGKWSVKVVANLMFFDNNALGKSIPFNKEVFVQAVEAPTFPGINAKSDSIDKLAYDARTSGLEIYAIRDLPQENL